MNILAVGAKELGIRLTPFQLDQFEAYFKELADWNQRINLTSVVEYEEVQVIHFLDSLTVILAVPGGLGSLGSVIDIGADMTVVGNVVTDSIHTVDGVVRTVTCVAVGS